MAAAWRGERAFEAKGVGESKVTLLLVWVAGSVVGHVGVYLGAGVRHVELREVLDESWSGVVEVWADWAMVFVGTASGGVTEVVSGGRMESDSPFGSDGVRHHRHLYGVSGSSRLMCGG